MVLKRKFNFQIRLFLTFVSLLWIVVITIGILLCAHDRHSRRAVLEQQIDLFNSNLLREYDRSRDISTYLDDISQYFMDTPLGDLVVGVYDVRTGRLLDSSGNFELDMSGDLPYDDGLLTGLDLENMTTRDIGLNKKDVFYYRTGFSNDSTLFVSTVLPYNITVSDAMSTDIFIWGILLLMLIVITLISYVVTLHVSRNIKLLRDFVDRAANDRDFVTYNDFPDDELGQITSQVVRIYNARSAAVAAREHEHNMALHAIEERSKLKRQLTNNISHELKTPVGIIKGYLDTVIEEPSMDENARNHFLIKAQVQVNRLCDLLNDLSTMTRLDESSSSVSIEPVDFREIVLGVIDEAETSGIIGNMHIKAALPYECIIMGNRSLLNSMLMNLVKNAVYYSRGTEINIKCVDTSERFYSFVFYDDGVGVPPESLSHLFERFYRVDTGRSRRNGGTGLGLPIVKSIVNAFGGTITVSNKETGGLQFTFTLRRPQNSDN
ncbi:MAG: HAMP domain-containing histidine kinase [Clostridiales bacterium]|nr:HAMP domain-containing histidine kinase [Clostridiales bacterium]